MSPGRRHALGLAYVPEDRHAVGTAPGLSVVDNLLLKSSSDPGLGSRWMLDRELMRKRAQELVERFGIAVADLDAPAGKLSGGNLQKVILARETQGEVKVLLAAQPTRGLDVGAGRFVWDVLRELRGRGAAVVVVSDDLDELLEVSDRIAVMYQGKIVGEVQAREADVQRLGEWMTGAGGDARSREEA